MDQKLNNQLEIRDKALIFYKNNKIKILAVFIILLLSLFFYNFLKINNEKKNELISQKFIEANLHLNNNQIEKSLDLYKEILLSQNEFYSVLALNTIIEKELIKDKKEIIKYFEILEDINLPDERKNLIIFKKALYLIKNEDVQLGKNLLKSLKEKNTKLNSIIEQIID